MRQQSGFELPIVLIHQSAFADAAIVRLVMLQSEMSYVVA